VALRTRGAGTRVYFIAEAVEGDGDFAAGIIDPFSELGAFVDSYAGGEEDRDGDDDAWVEEYRMLVSMMAIGGWGHDCTR